MHFIIAGLADAPIGMQVETHGKAGLVVAVPALKKLQDSPRRPRLGSCRSSQELLTLCWCTCKRLISCSTAAQAAKLKHQLSYEQRRNLQKDAEAAEVDLNKLQDNLKRLQSQADEAAQASAALEQELSAEVGILLSHMGLVDVMPFSLCTANQTMTPKVSAAMEEGSSAAA